MKYLCDQMLGTLAKWLRIYGFDTFYPEGSSDDSELLDISKKEDRVLITRDKKLIIRARRENIKTIEIDSINIEDQIRTVISDEIINSNNVLSRCILCNGLVDEIKKNAGTLMLDTFELLTKNLSNCTIEDYELNGEAAIYIFSSPGEGKKVIVGWTDNVNDQLFPENYIDPQDYKRFSLYNHIGEIQNPVIPKTLSNEPFVIVLEGDDASDYSSQESEDAMTFAQSPSSSGSSSGCSNVSTSNNLFLKNGLLNMLVWLSPSLYIFLRRRLLTRHRDQ